MTITNRYDPSAPNHKVTCGRTKCAELERAPHPAGVHLDQRHEFYDGPDSQLGALSMYVRDSARKIIRDAPALTAEVVDLTTYIDFLEDQAAHTRVDRDRGIREAMARSESCEHHGEEIKGLGEQVRAFDKASARSEAGRLAVLGMLFAVDELVRQHKDGELPDLTLNKLIKALADGAKKVHAAHDRAWKR
jgi:hypothetical protein